jgi:hypothetical protein
MKKHVCRLLVAVAAMLFSSAVIAGDWMFMPSYYSHDPVTPVQIGPRYQGGPYYTRPQGAYVRSGWRNLNNVIQVGGTTDSLYYNESWVQYGEQW